MIWPKSPLTTPQKYGKIIKESILLVLNFKSRNARRKWVFEMKKMRSELIAKLAKMGAGAVISAAVVVGFCAANRTPRESAVILSGIPQNSVSAEYKSPASVESNSDSENSQKTETRNSDETKPYPVNINTATSRQLQTLSGIGETKAAAIIEYREMHGGFSDIGELLYVSGIGEVTYKNIRDYVTVGDVPPKNSSTSDPKQTSKPSVSTSTTKPKSPIVNINTASLEELQKLPGIGSEKAIAIFQYRSVFGEFYDISEIKNVYGIDEGDFEKIRDYITVGNVSPRPVEDVEKEPEIPEKIYLDLNTATFSELCKLTGIGTVKARAIIDYRENYGDFYSIEEIKNVSGIGDKTFEIIRDYIYVEYSGRPSDYQNPEYPENPEPAIPPQSEPDPDYPVDLNTATIEELCTLPDIGEERAKAIIQYRIDHDGFSDIRELQNINGIGLDTVQKLRYKITV